MERFNYVKVGNRESIQVSTLAIRQNHRLKHSLDKSGELPNFTGPLKWDRICTGAHLGGTGLGAGLSTRAASWPAILSSGNLP